MLEDNKLEEEGFYKDISGVSKARTHWAINVMGLSLLSLYLCFIYIYIYISIQSFLKPRHICSFICQASN